MIDALVKCLLPWISNWAQMQEQRILREGARLSEAQLDIARQVGVRAPERVRVLCIQVIPLPLHPVLCWIAERLRLVSGRTAGMTLRYGLYIRIDCADSHRLFAHELMHVAQYERLGGFDGFLRSYLRECISPGYPRGALEREAQQAEQVTSRI